MNRIEKIKLVNKITKEAIKKYQGCDFIFFDTKDTVKKLENFMRGKSHGLYETAAFTASHNVTGTYVQLTIDNKPVATLFRVLNNNSFTDRGYENKILARQETEND